ncbi:hypothetical protein L596_005673 [Steinernema carpocapsae]|uniref:Uncharacterized protein n=1 Tax=Steinernema carpocapsae TaxID=34508 RepID=A0A4U8UZS8_STECR|nr:hypothetical protein L596_005673 [Steinernema carpocapsae]
MCRKQVTFAVIRIYGPVNSRSVLPLKTETTPTPCICSADELLESMAGQPSESGRSVDLVNPSVPQAFEGSKPRLADVSLYFALPVNRH